MGFSFAILDAYVAMVRAAATEASRTEAIDRAVNWVLGDPDVFLVSASDVRLLPRILQAASQAAPRPSDAEMSGMVEAQGMEIIFEGAKSISGR